MAYIKVIVPIAGIIVSIIIFLLTITINTYAFAWVVSESIVRATWKDKLFSIDLLASGHFLHSHIASIILNGDTGGIYLFATRCEQ